MKSALISIHSLFLSPPSFPMGILVLKILPPEHLTMKRFLAFNRVQMSPRIFSISETHKNCNNNGIVKSQIIFLRILIWIRRILLLLLLKKAFAESFVKLKSRLSIIITILLHSISFSLIKMDSRQKKGNFQLLNSIKSKKLFTKSREIFLFIQFLASRKFFH